MDRARKDRFIAATVLAVPGAVTLWALPQIAMIPGLRLCTPAGGLSAVMANLRASLSPSQALAGLAAWSLMVLAMTPPLLAEPLVKAAQRPRALRALTALALAYVAVWVGGGLAMLVAMPLLQAGANALGIGPLPLCLAAAVLWQASPWKQRALNLCHRDPPHGGLRAELRFGATAAWGCLAACWIWMLPPMLVLQDGRPLMVATIALLTAERLAPARRPSRRLPVLSPRVLNRKVST